MLWQERGVVNSIVELGSSSVGLVVYRREEGGRNNEYRANKAPQNISRQYAVFGVP